jgi:formylglycine-generating enzyme required for sulfatase activity
VVCQAALAAGLGILLVLLGAAVIRSARQHRWPQYGLARLLAMTLAAGTAVGGATRWYVAHHELARQQAEYVAARARYGEPLYAEFWDGEKPAHLVTISRPFYTGKCEVTQEEYMQIMGSNPSQFKGPKNPVEMVSWDQAQEFCKKVRQLTGKTVRLPTEAQWEYACRAGTRTRFYSGDADADLDGVAWYRKNSNLATHPVGQKKPNLWGLYDMHGNVGEMCEDWSTYYEAGAVTDPEVSSNVDNGAIVRILRGGNWGCDPTMCRSAYRDWYTPERRGPRGFRVVLPCRTP